MEVASMVFSNIPHSCEGLVFAAGLNSDGSIEAKSLFDLFYAHLYLWSQHLEAINLHPCAPCLTPNASEENTEHFKVEAGGGRVPEELA